MHKKDRGFIIAIPSRTNINIMPTVTSYLSDTAICSGFANRERNRQRHSYYVLR